MASNFTRVPSLEATLDLQIETLRRRLDSVLEQNEFVGALLMGSAARGEATHRSDLDVLVVLKEAPLTLSRVTALRDRFEKELGEAAASPLPCQFNFVLATSLQTDEPAMKKALSTAVVLVDKTGAITRRDTK